MGPSWVGWVAFLVLAMLIGVTSCQAGFGEGDRPEAGTEASQ